MESSILSEVDDPSILRAGLSTPLSPSSRLVTDPSAHAPAQRAEAQRLCALAQGRHPGCSNVGPRAVPDPPSAEVVGVAPCDPTSDAGEEMGQLRADIGIANGVPKTRVTG